MGLCKKLWRTLGFPSWIPISGKTYFSSGWKCCWKTALGCQLSEDCHRLRPLLYWSQGSVQGSPHLMTDQQEAWRTCPLTSWNDSESSSQLQSSRWVWLSPSLDFVSAQLLCPILFLPILPQELIHKLFPNRHLICSFPSKSLFTRNNTCNKHENALGRRYNFHKKIKSGFFTVSP